MEDIISYNFKKDIDLTTKEILKWKLDNPLSTANITVMDNIVNVNSCADYMIDMKQVISSDGTTTVNSITEFLTLYTTNTPKMEVAIDDFVDSDIEIVEIDDVFLEVSRSVLRCNNMGTMNVTTMITGDKSCLRVKVKVLKTKFTYELECKQSNITLYFIGTKPYILFEELMCEYVKDHCTINTLVPCIEYITDSILGDQDESRKLKPDIDNLVYEMYQIYGITIKQYLWEDSDVTCPITEDSELKLNKLIELLSVLTGKNLEAKHLYILVPIIGYYIHIKDGDSIFNNQKHYGVLMNIIKLFEKKWDVNMTSDIVEICSGMLGDCNTESLNNLLGQYIEHFA